MPYIVNVALILATCLVFYKLLLRRETFYKVNRYMLITCLAVSFALPLLQVPAELSLRRQPTVGGRESSIVSRESAVNDKQPATTTQPPVTSNEQQATGTQQPAKPATGETSSTEANSNTLTSHVSRLTSS